MALPARVAALAAVVASAAQPALGSTTDASVTLYFGCGCFWHVQHEFIEAERTILNRPDTQLTAIVGYAGGMGLNTAGRVCYPPRSVHRDDALDHAEVVQLTIPRSSVVDFAKVYWGLFVGINRVDVQDVGPDYRAVIGAPGGLSSELVAEISAAQVGVVQQAFTLQEGMGADADTLGQALVWVYDSAQFPFHQGEVYHQFHDDMMDDYPAEYNALRDAFVGDCRLVPTGCRFDDHSLAGECTAMIESSSMEGATSMAGGSGGSGGGYRPSGPPNGSPSGSPTAVPRNSSSQEASAAKGSLTGSLSGFWWVALPGFYGLL